MAQIYDDRIGDSWVWCQIKLRYNSQGGHRRNFTLDTGTQQDHRSQVWGTQLLLGTYRLKNTWSEWYRRRGTWPSFRQHEWGIKKARESTIQLRPRLVRWNVSDSCLNHLEQFQTEKNRNVSEVNQFKMFQVFILQPWNDKIGVSSDSDSLPSHFHWIWNVSTNETNDFTKWFWFDRETFLERNWNVSDSQWIWNCIKHTLNATWRCNNPYFASPSR
jgi:hypothetical protein